MKIMKWKKKRRGRKTDLEKADKNKRKTKAIRRCTLELFRNKIFNIAENFPPQALNLIVKHNVVTDYVMY